MKNNYVYISIFLMALITYLIRMLPLVIFKKPIKNRFIRSFLYYAPYITLSSLTVPAILYSTGDYTSAIIGMAAAVITAFISSSLPLTTLIGCLTVFIVQLF